MTASFLYDPDCRLCTRLAHFARQRIARNDMALIPATTCPHPLNADPSQTAIYIAEPGGAELVENHAIAALMRHMVFPWPHLAPVVDHTPFAGAGYRFIAAHRHHLGCSLAKK
ncbi:DUF393 domain-containing protein [Corynebacterium sp. ES2775-CONJ]|uniref:DUF393 domain-containing protein n=1 Tax=Corynebacterium sp. ES2775-CONJ TaxID=2974029 RepID=UPI00216979C9|nr:DUF393 domain-containing protein [Corynebacterium sp. ES2775-CONJ]MCS4490671.1 DUF393 domain-containing protein [Corynebacterium sp. ES2775-CONJ]